MAKPSAALIAPAFGLTAAPIDPIAINILNTQSSLYNSFLVPRSGSSDCKTATASAPGAFPGTFTCSFSGVAPITDNQYTVSYDRIMRDGKDKISGRWFWDNGAVNKPYGTASSLAFPRTDTQQNRFLSVTQTHVFSASKINELRLGYSASFSRTFRPMP